jgi:hypothetical protein
MDAIELLETQHRQVESFFEEYDLLSEDEPMARRAIFELIADALRTLAQLEERIFYPAARSGVTHVVLRRLGEGHRRMRALQASLLALEVGDPEFQGGLDALRAQFRRHRDLEPALFALAREQLGAERLGALGADLEQVLRELEPPEAVTGEAESPRA